MKVPQLDSLSISSYHIFTLWTLKCSASPAYSRVKFPSTNWIIIKYWYLKWLVECVQLSQCRPQVVVGCYSLSASSVVLSRVRLGLMCYYWPFCLMDEKRKRSSLEITCPNWWQERVAWWVMRHLRPPSGCYDVLVSVDTDVLAQ